MLRRSDRDAIEAAERVWWAQTSPSERVAFVDVLSDHVFSLAGIDRGSRLQRSVTRVLRRRR
jgi:hypothetical protein